MKLSVNNISFSYGEKNVLNDISFSVCSNEVLSVLGANGTGKTTLLRCINKLLRPETGQVFLDDVDLLSLSRMELSRIVGFVSQYKEINRTTVFDSVLLGRIPYVTWNTDEKDLKIAERVIKLCGLEDLAMKYTDEISGGENQLVQIARALTQQPKILIMDEPTNNLDIQNQHQIMKLSRNVVKNNDMMLITVIHDLNVAVRYSDRFLMLDHGKIYAEGGPDVINVQSMNDVYKIDAIVEDVQGYLTIIPR